MRRLWVAATLAVSVLSGCSSGDKPSVPDVTIPVETTVATTAPPATTEAPTTVAEPTTTAIAASPEGEVRAATQAYWAEFRRTALSLDIDDLGALSSWYARPDLASNALRALRESKDAGVTYLAREPSIFNVRIDAVRANGSSFEVDVCVADDLIEVSQLNTGATRLDGSLEATKFTFSWQKIDAVWRILVIDKVVPEPAGSKCD